MDFNRFINECVSIARLAIQVAFNWEAPADERLIFQAPADGEIWRFEIARKENGQRKPWVRLSRLNVMGNGWTTSPMAIVETGRPEDVAALVDAMRVNIESGDE